MTIRRVRNVDIGVVGCGYWGSKHLRVLHEIPEVGNVVAIDASEDRLREAQRAVPGVTCVRSLDEVIRDLDGVVVATPPRTHIELASIALEAGTAVLVEKPLATSVNDARTLVEMAEARHVPLMVGHTFEHNAAVWKLRELLESNELGRLYYVDSARLNLGLYQSDVNVIWDLAPHDISIFNYLLRSRPTWVQAWGSRHAHHFLEDVAYLRLFYEEASVTANIHVSWLDPCKVRRVTLVGSSKMAVYNDLANEERVRVFDKGVVETTDGNLPAMPMSYRYGEIRSPYLDFEEPLSVQDRHFVACVRDGTRPRTSGYEGLAVVEVLECAEISLHERRPVALAEVAEQPVELSGSTVR
jgi:predicted dehydrogenase